MINLSNILNYFKNIFTKNDDCDIEDILIGIEDKLKKCKDNRSDELLAKLEEIKFTLKKVREI